MVIALFTIGLIYMWYGYKAEQANPDNPDYTKALVATLFWPFSLFMKRYNQ